MSSAGFEPVGMILYNITFCSVTKCQHIYLLFKKVGLRRNWPKKAYDQLMSGLFFSKQIYLKNSDLQKKRFRIGSRFLVTLVIETIVIQTTYFQFFPHIFQPKGSRKNLKFFFSNLATMRAGGGGATGLATKKK